MTENEFKSSTNISELSKTINLSCLQ